MEKSKGFLAHDGRFFLTAQELTEYNRQQADDWQAWRAEEAEIEAVDEIHKALEYAQTNRI